MIGGLGSGELLLIFAGLLLLFGASKLPELARSMGTSMGEFKRAQKESELSLKDFERSLEGPDSGVGNKPDVKKVAANLGLDVREKTDEQILSEINVLLQK
ncbi:twin-arginine translocase TatA/TatE family subunit [Methanococcoides sp. SA1]|nr:twin-arginine translocase TatA/TatE family subunit [Methanococcoides sp. SA1]